MEQFLEKVATQVPSLVVLVWLVYQFNRSSKDERESRQKIDEVREQALVRLGDNCHGFQERLAGKVTEAMDRMSACVEKNTVALARNTDVITRAEHVLVRIEADLSHPNGSK
jgi:3-deoxy-D-arabino-heptulosonate 7-phosphate (DAHP) synthase class II